MKPAVHASKKVFLVFVALLGALLFVSKDAHAGGSFKLKSTEIQEQSGAWHIFVTIEMPKPPPIPHQTMRFLFTKNAVFERSLIDNHEGPVTNVTVLQNQTPSIESLDIDFSDASGKIFKITRFDFGITRDRGYEAGEYTVQLRTSDGIDIGGRASIRLKGDNPVVDRRAMNFNAKDNGIKKIAGVDAGAKVAQNDDVASSGGGNGDITPTGSAQPFIPADAYNKTPEEDMKVKPKSGCGCAVPGFDGSSGMIALLPLAALGLTVMRRRSRKLRQAERA